MKWLWKLIYLYGKLLRINRILNSNKWWSWVFTVTIFEFVFRFFFYLRKGLLFCNFWIIFHRYLVKKIFWIVLSISVYYFFIGICNIILNKYSAFLEFAIDLKLLRGHTSVAGWKLGASCEIFLSKETKLLWHVNKGFYCTYLKVYKQ